jgi:hypothetical protein
VTSSLEKSNDNKRAALRPSIHTSTSANLFSRWAANSAHEGIIYHMPIAPLNATFPFNANICSWSQ